MIPKNTISVVDFIDYSKSLEVCLDQIETGSVFRRRKLIIIKPNLVNASPFPITTPTAIVASLIDYIRKNSKARVVIAEGCGDACLDTGEIFSRLGYTRLSKEMNVELIDLNKSSLVRLHNPECSVLPEIYLPRQTMKGFLISVPVLKRHSLAQVTLSMKNMLGLAPPSHYQQGGSWKKSFFHGQMHRSIFDLNLYRKPDLSIIDATVGMAEYHLGGRTCEPPINKLVAGFDPVAVDSTGAHLLGLHWKEIPHICMAHGVLGHALEPGSTDVLI
ncbi:DUF362 domain-containing protein [Desulfonatronovibrio magnus]|uniref:DUF362 domain-containing protein n=1 Tax=Desulfonatronovibrio magnus TaxID=698827 RepID=UPI0005EB7747|nr:DUF362 domain-containing protein [Desulfonatronovibrio magnus]